MKTSVFNAFCVCSMLVLGMTTGMTFADEGGAENRKKRFPEPSPRERGGRLRPHDAAGKKNGTHFKSFHAVDANKDGELTFEEFSMMGRLTKMDEKKRRKLFNFLDRNKDGKLHMRELHSREPSWIGSLRKNFSNLDKDNNGGLDLGEFSKALNFSDKSKEMINRFFAKMDRNKNNAIERSELKWPSRPRVRPQIDFAKYDLNQSGGLDFEEYSKLPFMDKCSEQRRKHLFERIDTDNNGQISPKEVKAAHKMRRPRPPYGKYQRGPMRGGKEGRGKPLHRRHEKPQKGHIGTV